MTTATRIAFVDDDKGRIMVCPTGIWSVTSRQQTGEKAENYTTITIAQAGEDYVVAKESRWQGGPVRRMWKQLRGAANVRRFLGDGALSSQVLEKAGISSGQERASAGAGRSPGG